MRGDRHVEVERGGPEPVILGSRIAHAIGQAAEQDALEAEPLAVLHLGDGVIDVADRHDTHADEPVRRDRTIFLGEPVVVAADHGSVDLVMGDISPEHRSGDHGGKQHFGIHAVLVLFAHALLGPAGASGVGDLEAEGLPGAGCMSGTQIKEIRLEQRLTFDHQRVTAVGQVNRMRRSVAIFRWHSMGPALRRYLEMSIGGQQFILPGHCETPPIASSWQSSLVRRRDAGKRSASVTTRSRSGLRTSHGDELSRHASGHGGHSAGAADPCRSRCHWACAPQCGCDRARACRCRRRSPIGDRTRPG